MPIDGGTQVPRPSGAVAWNHQARGCGRCKTWPIPFADPTPCPRSRDTPTRNTLPLVQPEPGRLVKLFAPCPAPQEASEALQKCTWISLIWHPRLHFDLTCQHFFPLSRHRANIWTCDSFKNEHPRPCLFGLVFKFQNSISLELRYW